MAVANFVEKMGNLFEQSLFPDCTLVAEDGNKFKAHKGVLACQSPVFRAMFENQMVESKEGIVNIKNIKSPVLEQMLKFMYSAQAPKLGEMAMDLLEAADQYELDKLKVLCEQKLNNSISIENVCELLVFADRHCVKYLKTSAIRFIQIHAKMVMKSDGWKMLVEGNFDDLLDQILKAISGGICTIWDENVCELLVLANRNSTEHHNLIVIAIGYIKIRAKEVMKSDGWKILVDGNFPKLFDRILMAIFEGLPNTMGNENVCEILILAKQHSAEYLEIEAINYIQKNAKKVIESDGWKMLVEGNHAKLFDQIAKTIVNTWKFDLCRYRLARGFSSLFSSHSKTDLEEDIVNLFKQGLFTDCTLVAEDGKEFKAHKGILASRSPVFRAMFEQEIVEAKEGIINVKDIKTPVLGQMLEFIYSGTTPKQNRMAMDELVKAADQFQIAGFNKMDCLSLNVCAMLVLANRHSVEILKTKALNYISDNAALVLESEGWKMLVEGNHAELLDQILKAIIAQNE